MAVAFKIFIRKLLERSKLLRAMTPAAIRQKITPAFGNVNFGDLRKLSPVDADFGWRRGAVIDRYYIDKFLAKHSADIRGRVLEMGDSKYTVKFGGDRVTRAEALSYTEGNPKATIVGDLTKADNLASDSFDCIILTQTLQMIYDFHTAIANVHRILKPGGVLLMTTHGTSKMCRFLGVDQWGEYWRFTGQACQFLFEKQFSPGPVSVETYGNVLTATAFLQGICVQELTAEEMDFHDRNYEVIVAVRAQKK